MNEMEVAAIGDEDCWEYTFLQFKSMFLAEMTRALNDAGAKGWELVAVTNNDKLLGVNAIAAVMKPKDLAASATKRSVVGLQT